MAVPSVPGAAELDGLEVAVAVVAPLATGVVVVTAVLAVDDLAVDDLEGVVVGVVVGVAVGVVVGVATAAARQAAA